MRRTAPKNNGTLPMFTPNSDWVAPNLSELPSWRGQKRVGIDTEFKDPTLKKLGLGSRRGVKVAGYSFAFEDGRKFYIPVRHPEGNVDLEQGLRYLRDEARDFSGELVGAHIGTEIDVLAYEPTGPVIFSQVHRLWDVLIADALIYELHFDGYSLDTVAKRRGFEGKDETLMRFAAQDYGADLKKTKTWKSIIPDLPAKYVGPYGEIDAFLPLEVMRVQEKIIEELGIQACWKLESELLPVLLKMRQRGVRIDFDKLDQIEVKARADEKTALEEVFHLTGHRISPGDTMKIGACLPAFHAVGIYPPTVLDEKTKKPKISLDKEYLSSLKHPLGKAVHTARRAAKRYSTFVKSMRANAIGDRIHCTYRQIVGSTDSNEKSGAAFGRLSCVGPNLQQQPSDKEWRSIFVPEPGTEWACLDCCFSADTEILTKDRGFVMFPELLPSDLVAQFDTETKTIDFAQPLAYQRPTFEGEMVRIHSKYSIDLLVTPNHDCLLETNKGFEKVRADHFPRKHGKRQIMASEWIGSTSLTLTEQEIITSLAVQADGTLRSSAYRIWVSKTAKIERCQQYVTHTNSYVCEVKGNQTAFVVPLNAVPLLVPGPDKNFDRTKVLALSLEQRKFFLNELLKWDGSGSLCKGKATYASTNLHNALVVQEVATLSGVRAALNHWDGPGRKRCYLVYLSNKTKTTTETMSVTREPYSGFTYCVTMPKGTVVVRRNGKVAITSQSQQEPRWTTHFAAKLNLSGGRAAAEAYRSNPKIDNHQFMADLTGLPRPYAKALYLGLCYGEGGAKLCRGLGLPTRWCVRYRESGAMDYFATKGQAMQARKQYNGEATYYEAAGEEGQEILNTFNSRAPFIKELAKYAEQRARKVGKLTLFGGRVVNFPIEKDGSYGFTYKALNRVIQGSGGMQVKKALVDIAREMPEFFMQLQVHDEIDGSFESHAQMKQVARIMAETTGETYVPFRIDIEHGKNWGKMKQMCASETCYNDVDKEFIVNGVKETYWCPTHAVTEGL